jgi:hypothetical protein
MREMTVSPPEVVAASILPKLPLLPEATAFWVTYEAGNQVLGPKKVVAESYKVSADTSVVSFFDKTGKNVLAMFNFNNIVSIELIPKTGLPS